MSTVTKPADAVEVDRRATAASLAARALQSVWILGVLIVIVAAFGLIAADASSSRRQPHDIMQTCPSGPCSASA